MANGIKQILEYKSKAQEKQLFHDSSNPELEIRIKRVCEKSSDNVAIIANEPFLAFFRIQEHVRKSLPTLIDKKREIQDIYNNVQGASFDTEYAINAVNSIEKSRPHFRAIQDLLKNSLFIKQQLHYEQTRRQHKPTMYRAPSSLSRTQTLDMAIATASDQFRPNTSDGSPQPVRARSPSPSENRPENA